MERGDVNGMAADGRKRRRVCEGVGEGEDSTDTASGDRDRGCGWGRIVGLYRGEIERKRRRERDRESDRPRSSWWWMPVVLVGAGGLRDSRSGDEEG